MSRRLALIGLSSLLVISTAYAASGSTLTGSGSTAQSSSESPLLQAERQKRADDLTAALAKGNKIELQYRERLANFNKKQAAHRSQCRDQLRSANKTTYLQTLLQCYRGELAMEQDFLTFERSEFSALPGITDTVKTAVLSRIDLLADAEQTLTFAIDSKVYQTTDDVQEAKRNLHDKYRVPLWDALLSARADAAKSWVGILIVDLDAAQKGQGTLTDEQSKAWMDARACLATREKNLQSILSPGATGRKDALSAELRALPACLTLVQNLPNVPPQPSGSGSTMSSSTSSKP